MGIAGKIGEILITAILINSEYPWKTQLRRSITVFPAPQDSYDLSGFHH